MAHFAQIDESNLVTQVIVVANAECLDANGNESEAVGAGFCAKLFGGTWKQTSYNGRIRKNYAGIGYNYDAQRDAFIPPKPYASWVLNEQTCQWEAPVPMPQDVGTGEPPKLYAWDEPTTSWVIRPICPNNPGKTYNWSQSEHKWIETAIEEVLEVIEIDLSSSSSTEVISGGTASEVLTFGSSGPI